MPLTFIPLCSLELALPFHMPQVRAAVVLKTRQLHGCCDFGCGHSAEAEQWELLCQEIPEPPPVIREVKGKQPCKSITFMTEVHAESFFKYQRKLCGST